MTSMKLNKFIATTAAACLISSSALAWNAQKMTNGIQPDLSGMVTGSTMSRIDTAMSVDFIFGLPISGGVVGAVGAAGVAGGVVVAHIIHENFKKGILPNWVMDCFNCGNFKLHSRITAIKSIVNSGVIFNFRYKLKNGSFKNFRLSSRVATQKLNFKIMGTR